MKRIANEISSLAPYIAAVCCKVARSRNRQLSPHEVDDLMGETALRILDTADRIDDRGVKAYAGTIAANATRDYLGSAYRRSADRSVESDSVGDILPAGEVSPLRRVIARQALEDLHKRASEYLEGTAQEVFLAFIADPDSWPDRESDVAAMYGLTVGTVRVYLHRARKALR